MLITDLELREAIFQRSLHECAMGTLTNYIGGGKGVVGKSEHDYYYAMSPRLYDCGNVTTLIGKAQVRKRIRSLVKNGYAVWHDRECLYHDIDQLQCRAMFKMARSFWLLNGVLTGCENRFGISRMRTTMVDDIEDMADSCRKMLKLFFPTRLSDEEYLLDNRGKTARDIYVYDALEVAKGYAEKEYDRQVTLSNYGNTANGKISAIFADHKRGGKLYVGN